MPVELNKLRKNTLNAHQELQLGPWCYPGLILPLSIYSPILLAGYCQFSFVLKQLTPPSLSSLSTDGLASYCKDLRILACSFYISHCPIYPPLPLALTYSYHRCCNHYSCSYLKLVPPLEHEIPSSLVHSKKSLQWFSNSPLPSPHHRCFPLYWIVIWTQACCCCSHLKKQHKTKNYLNFTLMIIYHSMSLLCSQTLLMGCLCYYLWSSSAFSLKSAPLWLSRSQRKPLK